jgi:hypothetical protein
LFDPYNNEGPVLGFSIATLIVSDRANVGFAMPWHVWLRVISEAPIVRFAG